MKISLTFLALTLSLFLSTSAFALLALPTAANYESGRFLCEQKHANLLKHEKGFYVSVPLDYANPQKGTTDIYAFFSGGFDPSRETLLYFTGGPGHPIHWGLFAEDMGFNVLLLEQRGIGCSRPATVEQFLSPDYYSSEFLARDAETIRQYLNISKLTIFGVSYGTVPATMYASLFPQSTRALILEGVVESGNGDLWSSPHRRKILQKMLNTLPADILTRMNQVSALSKQPDTWFSMLARNSLMYNDGLKSLKEKLLKLSDNEEYSKLLKHVADMFAPSPAKLHILFTANDVAYFMVACQELGLAQAQTSTADSLINGKLVPSVDQDSIDTCRQLKASGTKTYYSKKYPVNVPVTYFQGSEDSATTAPGAIHHFKDVAQGSKQLLILVKGGHNPNLTNLRAAEEGQKELFQHAFRGEAVPKELLQEVQQAQSLRWTYTSKNF